MQAKISSFFKPTGSSSRISPSPLESDADQEREVDQPDPTVPDVLVTCSRRTPKPPIGKGQNNGAVEIDGLRSRTSSVTVGSHAGTGCSGKLLNKKRSYAQYHLELGQSDFLLHSCSVCGMMYTCGDELDEKAHKMQHKNYCDGLQFKGWQNERQILMPWTDGERIILVLDGDPPFHKRKVQEVVKLMERDLGSSREWLLHKLCKVFLFISGNRIVACLISEPIEKAYNVIPSTSFSKSLGGKDGGSSEPTTYITEESASKSEKPSPAILQFGNATFYREINKKSSSNMVEENSWNCGALFCSEESVEAVCGIRAIWVAPTHRRHKIATRLLDATRRGFGSDIVLETSQIAFSQPTSAGRAFAVSYTGTPSFLVYVPH